VGVALQRAAHERLALSLGQRVDGDHDARELILAEYDLTRLAHAVDVLVEALGGLRVSTRVQRPVANDRVEPRLHCDLLARLLQCRPGAGETVLNHVLGGRG
jgi:hypothetical protein